MLSKFYENCSAYSQSLERQNVQSSWPYIVTGDRYGQKNNENDEKINNLLENRS